MKDKLSRDKIKTKENYKRIDENTIEVYEKSTGRFLIYEYNPKDKWTYVRYKLETK